MKLAEIGEFGFIDRIAAMGMVRSRDVIKGIGDDCAVVSLEGEDCLLVTTDMLVERVHFLLDRTTPEALGAKSLAVNLSDIAACGGRPLDAFVSIAAPDKLDVEWLERFYRGMSDLARSFDVNILGGDTTGSRDDLVVNVALTGRAARDEVLFRHTARPGDWIILTGPLGESAAGLEILLGDREIPPNIREPLVHAHVSPRPHIPEGRLLAESGGCTAAIDVSDGLSSDLWHICRNSGVAAVLFEERLPTSEELSLAASLLDRDPLDWILSGGEDYVLLATLDPGAAEGIMDHARKEGRDFLHVGEVMAGSTMELIAADGSKTMLRPGGWDHFW